MSSERLTAEDRKEMKRAFKAAEKEEKQKAKAAKAATKEAEKAAKKGAAPQASGDDAISPRLQKKAEKMAAKEAKANRGPRSQLKSDKAAAKQVERERKMARYKQLRANVRRRRVWYVVFITFAIGVFAGSVWDIVYNQSDLMMVVFGAYAVVFLLAILFLFSRRRHLEEVEELMALERVFLEDPDSGEIFQLSASKMPDLVGLEFSSPMTGAFHKMPGLGAPQVERVLPAGARQTRSFRHNGIEGEVATFGKQPRDIRFR